jgi:hypothetical protein
MIVAEEVQQPVQRQHTQLRLQGMTGVFCLLLGNTRRDDDVAELRSACGRREATE